VELHEQREQNARLAVAADPARIAGDLDGYLHDQVDGIAAAAQFGRERLGAGPAEAQAAFVAIQATRRETLARMLGVVADLCDQTPTGPQPVPAQLDRLLNEATRADTRLKESGGGHGLAGMRERVDRCDRTVAAGPTTTQGWRVTVWSPRHPNREAATWL
jgi:hypothetical protein